MHSSFSDIAKFPSISVVSFAFPMTMYQNGCFLSVSSQSMLSFGFLSVS